MSWLQISIMGSTPWMVSIPRGIIMQWIARMNRAYIMIGVVGILAFTSTFAYLNSLDKKIAVAKLSNNVVAGDVISKSDIEYIDVSYDDLIAKNMVTDASFSNNSLVARTDLYASDLLTKSNTVRRSTNDGLQSLSLGIEADRANGGDIRRKDIVDIWRTGDDATLIASTIEVRDVIQPNKRLGISTTKSLTIVLAVTPEQAQNISAIVGSKDIMIVISTGSITAKAKKNTNKTGVVEKVAESQFEPLAIPSKSNQNSGD